MPADAVDFIDLAKMCIIDPLIDIRGKRYPFPNCMSKPVSESPCNSIRILDPTVTERVRNLLNAQTLKT